MKILVLTLSTPNILEYSKYTSAINKKYCKTHSYDFINYTHTLDDTRHPAWSKIKAIQKHINNYDWIMWIDADAIFLNQNIKIESLLDEEYNVIISKDVWKNINSGAFLIKGKTEWSSYFLSEVYNQIQFIDHDWWEQASIMHLYDINEEISKKIKLIHYSNINTVDYFKRNNCANAYINYSINDFVLHLARVNNIDRSTVFKHFYNNIVGGKNDISK